MKKFLLLIAATAFALLTTACTDSSGYTYETVKNDPLKTRIYTLDNGLKVYMSVNKAEPRIETYIAVKVGGKNDPSETTGLAHYFEHLMFKGTQQFGTSNYEAEKPLLDQIEQLFEVYRKTTDDAERAAIYRQIDSISYEASKYAIPNEYDKLMSAIGALETNANTSMDRTVYIENIPSNQIENWARIQADRFKNVVIRGFHTELETIYEEKNMSLTDDNRKVYTTIGEVLYPNHPYGKQSVLGTQEHLKNPSITNVKNYHTQYYVPNNMAILLSGDFDPDQMIATIDKYFGDMQPNENIPQLAFEPEAPITKPIVKEVYGPDAANVTLAWRTDNAASDDAEYLLLASRILYNGQAGMIDLDLMQQQKVLDAFSYPDQRADYGALVLQGLPKAGQTLDEVRDLLLAEVAKLRNGEFSEELIKAVVNNLKVSTMREEETNVGRVEMYLSSFYNDIPWSLEVLYKKNDINDLFSLTYLFDTGVLNDPALNNAFAYIDYLGTQAKTAAEIASELYDIACYYDLSASQNRCAITFKGLSENMGQVMDIFEDLVANAQGDEEILANYKADLLKKRADNKLNQEANFAALQRFAFFGGEAIQRTTLNNEQLEALTSDVLIGKVRDLLKKQHTILYYGPKDKAGLLADLKAHHQTPEVLEPLTRGNIAFQPTEQNKVCLANYNAPQLYFLQYSNLGKKFDVAVDPALKLYNEYNSGSMGAIVFQEMRESRSLAYMAFTEWINPSYLDDNYLFAAIIATQNDKMAQAIDAFDEIINNMPESEAAFKLAKEAVLTNLRTSRTIKDEVLWKYIANKDLGVTEDRNKAIFEKVQDMTFADLKAAQEQWIKDRKYTYCILGDLKDLDQDYLRKLGTVQIVSQKEMFGY